MAHREADNLRGALFHFSFEGERRNYYFDHTTFLFSFKKKKEKGKTTQKSTSRDTKLPKLRIKMQTAET